MSNPTGPIKTTGFTDEQAEAYGAYVRDLADRMELRDWRFKTCVEAASNPNWAASCAITYGRRYATITIDPETLTKEPEEIRQTIVHELVHCHTTPIRDQLENIEAQLGKSSYTAIHNATTDVLELATEAIANIIAPFMPMPPAKEG